MPVLFQVQSYYVQLLVAGNVGGPRRFCRRRRRVALRQFPVLITDQLVTPAIENREQQIGFPSSLGKLNCSQQRCSRRQVNRPGEQFAVGNRQPHACARLFFGDADSDMRPPAIHREADRSGPVRVFRNPDLLNGIPALAEGASF